MLTNLFSFGLLRALLLLRETPLHDCSDDSVICDWRFDAAAHFDRNGAIYSGDGGGRRGRMERKQESAGKRGGKKRSDAKQNVSGAAGKKVPRHATFE